MRNDSLFPFQREGVRAIKANKRVLLADEMGLGKTLQTIVALRSLKGVQKIAICAPASLLENWRTEWRKWTTTTAKRRLKIRLASYDKIGALFSEKWDALVFDEAHYMKTGSTYRTQSALELVKQNSRARVILLTGSPLLNRPIELLPLLLMTRIIRTKTAAQKYLDSFCRRVDFRTGETDFEGAHDIPKLRDALAKCPRYVRRTKTQVAKWLPPKRHRVVVVGHRPRKITALQTFLKDRPDHNLLTERRRDEALAKVPWAVEHVKRLLESDKKDGVVVFAHHRDVIARFRDAFSENIYTTVVDGSVTGDAKQKAIDKFNLQPAPKLFLGSIRACGHGFNLTSASRVVFAELDWTPAAIRQAEDRCHRIGQRSTVFVDYLVLPESLDWLLARVLVMKSAMLTYFETEALQTAAPGMLK